ncbi:hypothetical protein ACGF3G_41030 [Streptomyces sp. NPDC048179]|uniref:hypothetical protein n=1 Tax=Streptomyces sp. NPDC048179 TaxID=3365506 RepID=UPI003719DE33
MVGRGLPQRRRQDRKTYFGLTPHAVQVLTDRRDRVRLIWAGFGPLQNGLWVAPARADVREMVAGLGMDPCLRGLRAEVESPTEVREVLEQAFGVPAIGARYRAFLER